MQIKLKYILVNCAALIAAMLQGCTGILGGIYDDPPADDDAMTANGQLYINASDWGKWYFLDLPAVAAKASGGDEVYSDVWVEREIPETQITGGNGKDGIYVYWFDVLGAGLEINEFREFIPTAAQQMPEHWTIAVHRNNVMTNGCLVAATTFDDFDDLPEDKSFLSALTFEGDTWTENEVWCVQERMLQGLIGSQGISVNRTLSSWLEVSIPPIPPAFNINRKVFIIKLTDGTYGALRLQDYQSPTGVKCCLTINYRYPL